MIPMDLQEYIEVGHNEEPTLVKKDWGSELWLANSEKYCGKILRLKKGYQCSLHMHPQKDEIIMLIKGEILMEYCNKKIKMFPGEYLHIRPGEFHRFAGLEDSEMIEFSSYHKDEDVVRLSQSGQMEDQK